MSAARGKRSKAALKAFLAADEDSLGEVVTADPRAAELRSLVSFFQSGAAGSAPAPSVRSPKPAPVAPMPRTAGTSALACGPSVPAASSSHAGSVPRR